MRETIIELTVKNHPGAMSHVTGLFARRAFNLEAIWCAPLEDRTRSRMLLMVKANGRLPQLMAQLEKLYDVFSVRLSDESASSVFDQITRRAIEDR